MTRYLPILLGILLIVGLTIPQIRMTDRFSGTNISAEQQAELLKQVPLKVGDWQGQDAPVDPKVRKTAGAIGAVSRTYRNSRTGELVDLWLIVGHARDITAHTPDICYPGQGFEARAQENSPYMMVFPDQPDTPFLTNTFFRENDKGRQLIRVFWTWYNPERAKGNKEEEGKVVWEAPTNARWMFGNTRALYKMYFTSQMRDLKETAELSPCIRFARDFLPVVNKALAEVHNATPNGEVKDHPAADQNAAEPKAAAPKTGESTASEAATSDSSKTGESSAAKELFGTDPPTTPSKTGP